MKEYQFQYTKVRGTLIVVLSAIAIFILTEVVCAFAKLNLALAIILSFGLAFLVFQAFKRKAVYSCRAKLSETCVVFEFENDTKTFNFNELTSYKSYYGKNGPVLYLRNDVQNFKISANNNFCKTDAFKLFCDNVIAQLDKFKEEPNLALIHEGSVFTNKSMWYFLIVATSIYLLAFLIETKTLRIAVGIGIGFLLFILWTKYLIENNKTKNQNRYSQEQV